MSKRQKEVLDYLRSFAARHGYAPTLAEVGGRFRLRSVATVHKHLENLERKGFVRRERNRSRSVEVVAPLRRGATVDLPHLGVEWPLEPLLSRWRRTTPLPSLKSWPPKRRAFVLKVKADSMIDEQIRDGDVILVESCSTVDNGQTVVALVNGEATVKKFYRENNGKITLRPANPSLQSLVSPASRIEVRGVVVAVIRKY